MMRVTYLLLRLIQRLRYPNTMPEDVALDLGVKISNFISFDEFVGKLVSPECQPTKLKKFMPRKEAENTFLNAQKTEKFKSNTLCSYYFNEGWMEFILKFDELGRLRRVYLQHKRIHQDTGIEIPIP